MDEIRNRLLNCLDRNGIDFSDETQEIDSISFITVIVDIEREFDIEFPDEYLVMDSISSFDKLYEIVSMLVDTKKFVG